MNSLEKINKMKNVLNKKFFEREEEVEGMLLAILARQHVLLIGEPGTGKSQLSMELSKMIDGSTYFQWLLTQFSIPEELFGALNLKKLEEGSHERNTSGKLPESHFVFLDEVFKANSAILNSLLTVINERLFYNNGTPTNVPLVSMIGASNEFPEEDEGLEALYDRFLLRYEVKSIRDRNNFISVLKNEGNDLEMPSLTLDELNELQFFSNMTHVSDDIYEAIERIRQELSDEGIHPSIRRFKNSINVLQAKAFINQRQSVEIKDLLAFEHMLWNTLEQKEIVSDIVKSYAQDIVESTLERIEKEAEDIISTNENNSSTEISLEINQKLKSLAQELMDFQKEYPERNEIKIAINSIQEKQKKIVDNVLLPI